jgi:hypothetical protein
MSTSIARIQKLPKSFPFAKRGKQLIPKAFDLGYHVTVLGKYSKKIPKREPSALDLRQSQSTVKWMNDTRKFDPRYYREH